MTQAKKKSSSKPKQKKTEVTRLCAGFNEALEATLSFYFETMDAQSEARLHSLITIKVERTLFTYVLKKTGYNLSKAATILGMSRSTLSSRLKKYKISVQSLQNKSQST